MELKNYFLSLPHNHKAMIQKIYRYEIQDVKEGLTGPYTARHLYDSNMEYRLLQSKMCKKHNNDETTYPGIRLDINEFVYDKTFCACPSLKALKTWFKGFNSGLLRVGFNLVEYTVTKIIETESGKQCGFFREDIISVKIIK